MRISDWSSDVCSSDLRPGRRASSDICRDGGDAGRLRPLPGTVRLSADRRGMTTEVRQEELLIAVIARMLDGLRHVAVGASSPIPGAAALLTRRIRSEEHTSELQSLMRISYAVFCLKKKTNKQLRDIHIIYT